MGILKKINKGLILTVIVLLILIIYLKGVEKQRKSDEENVKVVCEQYIKLVDSLIVLPSDMQTYTDSLSIENQEKMEENINNELKKVMVDNKDAIDIQKNFIYEILEEGISKNKIKIKSQKTITKVASYEFDGDQVTVSIKTKLETTYKHINEETKKEEESQNTEDSISGEEIILQKVNGEWKIVYSYLIFSNSEDVVYLY